jgi:hypothetical protein
MRKTREEKFKTEWQITPPCFLLYFYFLTAIVNFHPLSENFAEKFWPQGRKLVLFFLIYATEISANLEHCTSLPSANASP